MIGVLIGGPRDGERMDTHGGQQLPKGYNVFGGRFALANGAAEYTWLYWHGLQPSEAAALLLKHYTPPKNVPSVNVPG